MFSTIKEEFGVGNQTSTDSISKIRTYGIPEKCYRNYHHYASIFFLKCHGTKNNAFKMNRKKNKTNSKNNHKLKV